MKPALKIHILIYLSILLAFDQATLLNKDSLPNELPKFEINNVTVQSQSLFKRYLKLWMNCLNASVLFDRGTMMLMRMLRVFRLSLFTFTTGPNGLKSTSWVKSREPSPLNISSYTVPLSRSVRVNPETEAERKQGNHNPRFICSYSLMHLV